MTAKHTAGPWTFYADLPSTEPNWHIVTTANRMRILANVHIEPGNETDLANARLIAAAPELLAALRIHHEWCANHQPGYSEIGEDRVAYRSTAAAIAKATGATS